MGSNEFDCLVKDATDEKVGIEKVEKVEKVVESTMDADGVSGVVDADGFGDDTVVI